MRDVRVAQHDDGTWYTRLYQGTDPLTKKKLRKYKRFPDASSEEEALEMARDWAASLPAGGSESARLVDVLNRYVAALPAMGAAENTCKSYAGVVRRVIAPNVGNIDADELRPRHVEALYSIMLSQGLAPSTVNQVHWFLKGAYKWIVREELSPFDPMQSVSHPRAPQREAEAVALDAFDALNAELTSWVMGTKGPRLVRRGDPAFGRNAAMAAFLSLWTGMRCGECCGLLASDYRPSTGDLHVGGTVVEVKGAGAKLQRSTKGRRPRNLAMPPTLASAMEAHMLWRRGVMPADMGADGWLPVCCLSNGGFLRPSDVSEWFAGLARTIGLPEGTTFHALRHTHATYLIHMGVDMRTVQERLGHADVSTTLRLYAHMLPGRDRDAAEAFERVAGSGR